MSLYQTNKAIKLMAHNDDQGPYQAFLADAAAFLGQFDLTPEERQALLVRDYAALYGMGVQPFILQSLAHKLSGEPFFQFIGRYAALLANLGHPDYET